MEEGKLKQELKSAVDRFLNSEGDEILLYRNDIIFAAIRYFYAESRKDNLAKDEKLQNINYLLNFRLKVQY